MQSLARMHRMALRGMGRFANVSASLNGGRFRAGKVLPCNLFGKRLTTTREQDGDEEWMVRDHIRDLLYDESGGYFVKQDCVLKPGEQLPFNKMMGYYDYIRHVDKLYKDRDNDAWLTPAEIFQPWYSRGIAKYVLGEHNREAPLQIFEIGGGNGTNALHILDYIKEKSPETYLRTRYHLVEISPTMSERQASLVKPAHPQICKVITKDILEWDTRIDGPCFVIALEVLDNLPHDKLVRKISPNQDGPSVYVFSRDNRNEWFETVVYNDKETGMFRERLRPLHDKLALRAAKYFLGPSRAFQKTEKERKDESFIRKLGRFLSNPSMALSEYSKQSIRRERMLAERPDPSSPYRPIFVPTGAFQLIQVLSTYFPRHRLVVSDFDELPPPELSLKELYANKNTAGSLLGCRNAPLVSRGKKDFPTYLVPRGTADIFFQTDFEVLCSVYNQIARGAHPRHQKARVLPSNEFLRSFADHRKTRTRNGYNPLLEDYGNTKFLLS